MSDNFEKYHAFRKKYKECKFNNYSYSISGSVFEAEFNYEISGLETFKTKWSFELPAKPIEFNEKIVEKIVYSLGMAEMISYWKIACPPTIKIECAGISESEIAWWKKLYRKGLGEFFYTNSIFTDEDFVDIISDININETHAGKKLCKPKLSTMTTLPKAMIPIGGGKDSAVTLELLRGYADRYSYIINPRGASLATVKSGKLGADRQVVAKRVLDKKITDLNSQGFLNGHTPFSAIVANSSLLAAYLLGIPYIALSNEASANESTVAGCDVNHQYSKSYEFEKDFISYEAAYIKSGVSYFSFLRPFTELKIAQVFAELEDYHDIFRSCNVGSKQDIWCGRCPKCLFVYIILSPFLPPDRLCAIFGRNLLEDLSLETDFLKLIGALPEKPFECVGSIAEVNAAVCEVIRQHEENAMALPALLKKYTLLEPKDGEPCDLEHNGENAAPRMAQSHGVHNIDSFLKTYDKNNFVPKCFKEASRFIWKLL